jgi:hypothetical protein
MKVWRSNFNFLKLKPTDNEGNYLLRTSREAAILLHICKRAIAETTFSALELE